MHMFSTFIHTTPQLTDASIHQQNWFLFFFYYNYCFLFTTIFLLFLGWCFFARNPQFQPIRIITIQVIFWETLLTNKTQTFVQSESALSRSQSSAPGAKTAHQLTTHTRTCTRPRFACATRPREMRVLGGGERAQHSRACWAQAPRVPSRCPA